MNNFLSDLIINLVVAGLGAATLKIWDVLRNVTPSRRLWMFRDPKKIVICISANPSEDSDYPLRVGTGGGQIRALGLIQKSLERAYRPANLVRNILLSTDQLGRHLEYDLILLGGPEYNPMTKNILQQIEDCPIRQSQHEISWHGPNQEQVFCSEINGEMITKDYGFVLRAANPYSNGKTTVVIFSGCHAYGTLAAAYYFTEVMLNGAYSNKFRKKNLAMIVSAPVVDGWVPRPKLVHFMEWTN